jgi:hypothetical protein
MGASGGGEDMTFCATLTAAEPVLVGCRREGWWSVGVVALWVCIERLGHVERRDREKEVCCRATEVASRGVRLVIEGSSSKLSRQKEREGAIEGLYQRLWGVQRGWWWTFARSYRLDLTKSKYP